MDFWQHRISAGLDREC